MIHYAIAKRDDKDNHITKGKEYSIKERYPKEGGQEEILIKNDRGFYKWTEVKEDLFSIFRKYGYDKYDD